MAAELKCRISADGSGFVSTLRGLEGKVAGFTRKLSNYFGSYFTAQAAISLVRRTIESVREIDKLAQKYGIATSAAQQLSQWAEKYNQDLSVTVKNADELRKAFIDINKLGIKPAFDEKQLQAIRDADNLFTQLGRSIEVEVAQQLTRIMPWWERFTGKLGWGQATMAGMELTPATFQKWSAQQINRLMKSSMPGVNKPDMSKAGVSEDDPFWFESLTREQQNTWEALAPRMKLGRGAELKEAAVKSLGMKPDTDALARIGGFVGPGDKTQAMAAIRSMNRHLSNIERALLRHGIKIQEIG